MQKAVVSACASTLPAATACWYLLHISATASIPPLRGTWFPKPHDSGFAGFIYFYLMVLCALMAPE